MTARLYAVALALGSVSVPRLVAAQGSPSPVADAFRADEQSMVKNLVAALEEVQVGKGAASSAVQCGSWPASSRSSRSSKPTGSQPRLRRDADSGVNTPAASSCSSAS